MNRHLTPQVRFEADVRINGAGQKQPHASVSFAAAQAPQSERRLSELHLDAILSHGDIADLVHLAALRQVLSACVSVREHGLHAAARSSRVTQLSRLRSELAPPTGRTRRALASAAQRAEESE